MNAARTRIGRVKMKNGGADVRVLHRNPARIVRSIGDFAKEVAAYSDPPSAFVAVAFWPSDDGEPWRTSHLIRWDTCDPDLPLPRLTRVAAAQIAEHGTEERALDRTMRSLGYRRDDEPDPAS